MRPASKPASAIRALPCTAATRRPCRTSSTDMDIPGNSAGHCVDLTGCQLGIYWKRKHFPGGPFGQGKVAAPVAEICIGALEMHGNRIMQPSLHAFGGERFAQMCPVPRPNGIDVIDMAVPGSDVRQLDRAYAAQQTVITSGMLAPLFGPGIEMPELDAEHCPLNRVHAIVEALGD